MSVNKQIKHIELNLFKQGFNLIAGVDEAGRGCLAGPLVSAAVILDRKAIPKGIKDSKLLTQKARERIYEKIINQAKDYNIVAIEATQIDQIGLQKANLESFYLAVDGLKEKPDYILSDWYKIDGFDCPTLSIMKGEQKSVTIAAASILAKVFRDRLMVDYHKSFPGYGFSSHKGYGTYQHKEAILKMGPTPIHRFTFAGVSNQKKLI